MNVLFFPFLIMSTFNCASCCVHLRSQTIHCIANNIAIIVHKRQCYINICYINICDIHTTKTLSYTLPKRSEFKISIKYNVL